MKADKKILIAFLLNLCFSIFEFIGGTITGSVAILSDAMHDMGDAISIGISYFLEKKSKKKADNTFTYGYVRYSVFGAVVTTSILMVGSIIIIYNAIMRILHPVTIDYQGMILLALIGVVVNIAAAYVTKDGNNVNQKAVNLHMLEDVLGWVVVLIGAIIMRFIDIPILDPILSILVASYILYHACLNLKKILEVFLEKVPENVDLTKVQEDLLTISHVQNVHHIHVWTIDGSYTLATMHVVVDATIEEYASIKKEIRHLLKTNHIDHVTLEFETNNERCHELEDEPNNKEFGASCAHEHQHYHEG